MVAGWWSPSSDQHQVVVVDVLHERDEGAERVLDRLTVSRSHRCSSRATDAPGDLPCAGMPSKIEPSPTAFQSTSCGSGAHGVCDDTRSISAITGAWFGLASSQPLERRQHVLVGHRGVAELRPGVADVVLVVELVVVIEGRSLGPAVVVRRDVADRAPARSLERIAEREPVAGDELVVALLVVDPEPGLQGGVREPADAAERRRGQERATGGKPAAARLLRCRRSARRRPGARRSSPGRPPGRSSRRTRR